MAITTKLTLGPILYNWPAKFKKDFYYKIADESPVDVVYIGEVVCHKRYSRWQDILPDVTARLQSAGKEVVLSSLSLINSDKELIELKEILLETNLTVEANDITTVSLLNQRAHCLGPYLNVYNELALNFHATQNAFRLCLQAELAKETIELLTKQNLMAIEVQVFGRQPLAISARCAHARAYNTSKRKCQFICEEDMDGLDVYTLDNDPFVTLNGLQTLSYAKVNLLSEISALQHIGVDYLRISPQSEDTYQIIEIFHQVTHGKISPAEGNIQLENLLDGQSLCNGYFNQAPGYKLINQFNEH